MQLYTSSDLYLTNFMEIQLDVLPVKSNFQEREAVVDPSDLAR